MPTSAPWSCLSAARSRSWAARRTDSRTWPLSWSANGNGSANKNKNKSKKSGSVSKAETSTHRVRRCCRRINQIADRPARCGHANYRFKFVTKQHAQRTSHHLASHLSALSALNSCRPLTRLFSPLSARRCCSFGEKHSWHLLRSKMFGSNSRHRRADIIITVTKHTHKLAVSN